MGRVKTDYVKRMTRELMKKEGVDFTKDFDKNKLVLGKIATIPSKKIRNTIAGYTTRLVKAKEKPATFRKRSSSDEY